MKKFYDTFSFLFSQMDTRKKSLKKVSDVKIFVRVLENYLRLIKTNSFEL